MSDASKTKAQLIAELEQARARIAELESSTQLAEAEMLDGLLEAQSVARIGSWRYDVARDEATWTPEMYRIFDRDPDSGPPAWKDHRPHIHPDDWDRLDRVVTTASERGEGYREEFRVPRRDGSVTWAETICRVIRGPDGTIVRLTGTVQDITWRKTIAQKLREGEENFRSLVEALPISILLLRDGAYTYGNPAATQMLGYADPEQLSGLPALETIAPEQHEQVRARMARLAEGGSNPSMELELVRPDGTRVWTSSLSVPVRVDGRATTIIVGQDITERRSLEQQVARAQRLEAMGQLSAGVSHEYNNLLMGIIGYAHHLKRRVAVDTEAYLFASKIIEISEQAARVSRQLLDFARPQEGPREVLDIDRLVDGTLSTFGKLIGEDIVVHMDLKAATGVELDPEQIQDVLVNVLLNARDAMPDGGRLRVETRLIRLETELAARLDLLADRQMVRIAVIDTGTGMPPEVLERLFEPFYTTKPHGHGTGLGLAAAMGIVRAHGGAIQVLSEPDQGTTVNLFLPAGPRAMNS